MAFPFWKGHFSWLESSFLQQKTVRSADYGRRGIDKQKNLAKPGGELVGDSPDGVFCVVFAVPEGEEGDGEGRCLVKEGLARGRSGGLPADQRAVRDWTMGPEETTSLAKAPNTIFEVIFLGSVAGMSCNLYVQNNGYC